MYNSYTSLQREQLAKQTYTDTTGKHTAQMVSV